MSITNLNIATLLTGDFAAGRLDDEDAQAVQGGIDRDEVIATVVLDARRAASRMNACLAIPALTTPDRARVAYLP